MLTSHAPPCLWARASILNGNACAALCGCQSSTHALQDHAPLQPQLQPRLHSWQLFIHTKSYVVPYLVPQVTSTATCSLILGWYNPHGSRRMQRLHAYVFNSSTTAPSNRRRCTCTCLWGVPCTGSDGTLECISTLQCICPDACPLCWLPLRCMPSFNASDKKNDDTSSQHSSLLLWCTAGSARLPSSRPAHCASTGAGRAQALRAQQHRARRHKVILAPSWDCGAMPGWDDMHQR